MGRRCPLLHKGVGLRANNMQVRVGLLLHLSWRLLAPLAERGRNDPTSAVATVQRRQTLGEKGRRQARQLELQVEFVVHGPNDARGTVYQRLLGLPHVVGYIQPLLVRLVKRLVLATRFPALRLPPFHNIFDAAVGSRGRGYSRNLSRRFSLQSPSPSISFCIVRYEVELA